MRRTKSLPSAPVSIWVSYAQRYAFKSRSCLNRLSRIFARAISSAKDPLSRGLPIVQRCQSTFNRSRNESAKRSPGQPFDPPSRKAIESDPQARQVVRFLIENGDVTELALDVVLLRESFERMKSQVAEFISKNGPATVSQLRQALGSSRRIMVPFLERLDREGFTRRMGDKRSLRSNR